MAGDLLDLAERLEKRAADIDKAASEIAVDVALSVLGHLAFHTPVDTSQAISSWIVTLGSQATHKNLPHFPGLQGSTFRASANETIAIGKRVLKAKKPGQAIFITNNQPYIRRLNDGTLSKQPGGFKEAALLVGRKTLAKAISRAMPK